MKHKTHRRALTSDFPCRPSLIALGVHVEFAVAATRPVVARQPVAQGAGEAVTGHAHAPAVAPASRAINCNRAEAESTKTCKKCGTVKPLSEFFLTSRDGYQNRCQACTKAAARLAFARRQTPDVAVESKTCTACGAVKPLSAFRTRAGSADGHVGECQRCRAGARSQRVALAAAARAQVAATASVEMRECECCGDVKPATEFRIDLKYKDGYVPDCVACEKDEALKLQARAVERSAAAGGLVTFESLTAAARRLKGQPAVYQHGRSKITAVFDKKTDTTRYAVSGWPCPAEDLQHIFRVIHSGQPVNWLP